MEEKKIEQTEAAEDSKPERYVELADGSILPGSANIDDDGNVWLWTDGDCGMSVLTMVTFLSDAERIKAVSAWAWGSMIGKWEGCKAVRTITQTATGSFKVGLRR